MKKNLNKISVFKIEKGWTIRKSDALRASFNIYEKAVAVSKAREYRYKGYDVYIYKADGTIQEILLKL